MANNNSIIINNDRYFQQKVTSIIADRLAKDFKIIKTDDIS